MDLNLFVIFELQYNKAKQSTIANYDRKVQKLLHHVEINSNSTPRNRKITRQFFRKKMRGEFTRHGWRKHIASGRSYTKKKDLDMKQLLDVPTLSPTSKMNSYYPHFYNCYSLI